MVSPAENSSTPLLFQNPAARRPTALQTSRKNRQGETNAVVRAAGKRRVEAPTRREMEVLSSDISRTLVKAHGRVQSAARTRVRAEYRLAPPCRKSDSCRCPCALRRRHPSSSGQPRRYRRNKLRFAVAPAKAATIAIRFWQLVCKFIGGRNQLGALTVRALKVRTPQDARSESNRNYAEVEELRRTARCHKQANRQN